MKVEANLNPREPQRSEKKSINTQHISSIAFFIIGALAVIAGSLLAGGMFGGGYLYLIGGGLFVLSIIPFVLSTLSLCKEKRESLPIEMKDKSPATQTTAV